MYLIGAVLGKAGHMIIHTEEKHKNILFAVQTKCTSILFGHQDKKAQIVTFL